MSDIIKNAIFEETHQPVTDGAILGVQDEDAPSRMLDYYFDIVTNHSLSIQNQITDNYLENNTAVADHIAHAPLTITLSGLSGDVVYKSDTATEDFIRQLNIARTNNTIRGYEIVTKLSTATVLLPQVNNTMQVAFNKANRIISSVNRYLGIVRTFLNKNDPVDYYTGVNQMHKNIRLREVYQKLKLLSDSHTSLWVHTPYGDFEDMYIQSITLRQENINFATDIEVTLKQLRFAEVINTKPDEKVMSMYNAQARANAENNGKTQGTRKSIAAKIYDGDKDWGF